MRTCGTRSSWSDWCSGELRDRAINAWLLPETLNGLRTIDHPRVQKLVDRLSEASDDLLTQDLLALLESVVRTSYAAEAVNSVLRPFLENRRECTHQTSRQLFLNLFTLWFNMHPFERGPRAGKSPYQLAGIDLGTGDWLILLGYPPD